MPTNAITFAADELDMVWKEPYLTEGLNEKALVMPRGVYRGFEVIPSGVALNIAVVAALPKNDHLAIIETQNNYSLTVRRSTGNFNVDLTAYASQTVVVALYATYSIGTPTAGFVRLYTAAEYAALTSAEQAELTILCTVAVPAAGVIPAANITFDLRTYPWQSLSPNFLPWRQILRNGTFELGRANTGADSALPYWIPKPDVVDNVDAYFRRTVTDPASGLASLEYYQAQAGTFTRSLFQFAMIPVAPNQRLRLSFKKKCITVPASLGSADVFVRFVDATGAILGTYISASIALAAPDASYVDVTVHGVVPAGAVALSGLEIYVKNLNYTPGGTVMFRLDAVSLLLQSSDTVQAQDYGLEAMNQFIHANRLVVRAGDPAPMSGFAGREVEIGYLDPSFGGTVPAEGRVFGVPVNPSTNPLLLEAPQWYWGGVANFGEYMLNTPARAQRARITAMRADFLIHPRTRIMELPPGVLTGGLPINIYRSWDGGLDERIEIVVNAFWNDGTSQWNKSSGGVAATRWYINALGMRCETVAAATAAWVDTAWDPAPYQTSGQGGWAIVDRSISSFNGYLRILSPQTVGTSPSNAVGTSVQTVSNALYAKNIPKHFARLIVNGLGAVTIDDNTSFNIAAASLSPSTVLVTLMNALMDATYVVTVSVEGGASNVFVAKPIPITGATYEIELRSSAGALISAATNACVLHVTLFGRQA